MAFLPAWAVDGSRVPASMARRATHALSGGANGVVEPGDLKVLALDVPGSAVQIMPGSALASSGYPQAGNQTWALANDASDGDAILAVPATGSGAAATRYVIARVDDPEFGGQEPADPLDATYSRPELVSSLAGLNFPHVALARIDQPASTATITQAMIADLRRMVRPRVERVFRARNITSTDGVMGLTQSSWGNWPTVANWQVEVPAWATRVRGTGHWNGVQLAPGQSATGEVTILVTGLSGGDTGADLTVFDFPSASAREDFTHAFDVPVPEAMRGTVRTVRPRGRKTGGAGVVEMTGSSSFYLDLEFYESAV